MILAFYPLNCGFDRHSFDTEVEPKEIAKKLVESKAGALFYDTDDMSDFVEDYNNNFIGEGRWCVPLNMSSDDLTEILIEYDK